MKNLSLSMITCLICCLTTDAAAAEAVLDMRAQIIRCATYEEAVKECNDGYMICCDKAEAFFLLQGPMTAAEMNNIEPAAGEEEGVNYE